MRKYICIVLAISFANLIVAQSYISVLDHQAESLERKMASFPNGDILIGDSSIEGLRDANIDGKIYLVRVDQCGAILWSNTYHQRDVYLELRDVKVASNGHIFAYGSAFRNGFEELIYLLKVSPNGEMEKFNLFRPGTIDHFSYSIDINDQNEILCYGLLLDFDTQKQGFVSIFDAALNFQWGVKFAPFETGGEAIFTQAGNILCRSDAFLFHLNGAGDLIWATELNIEDVGVPLAGPVEVRDGFILQGHRAGLSFFYKVSATGALIWKSEQVPSDNYPMDMTRMEDGNVIASYGRQVRAQSHLAHIILTPSGDILHQRTLDLAQSVDIAQTVIDVQGRNVHIIANKSLYDRGSEVLGDFLIRFSLDTLQTSCFFWQENMDQSSHTQDLTFRQIDTLILSSEMTWVNDTRDYWMPSSASFEAVCDTSVLTADIQMDTLLPCGVDWVVDLPAGGFTWTDTLISGSRTIKKAGNYIAKNVSCSNPIELTFTLNRPGCACHIFIPDAFTPNGDQINDELEAFSDCDLSVIEVNIYDRWGREIHKSTRSKKLWNGRIDGRDLPSGVYVARMHYELFDEDGALQRGVLTQELHLIR